MKRLFCTATAALLAVATTDAQEEPLPQSAGQVRPMLVGAGLPTAVLTGDDDGSLDLAAAVAGKPAVLVFYRGGW